MKIKIVVSVILALLLYAWQDVLLWATIFERDELWQYAGTYHRGWYVMLWGLIAAGLVWTWPSWRAGLIHGAALYTLAHSGLEDVLYYLLQGRPIPDVLPWLDAAPLVLFSPVTQAGLLLSAAVWVGGWLLVLVLYQSVPIGTLLPRGDPVSQ